MPGAFKAGRIILGMAKDRDLFGPMGTAPTRSPFTQPLTFEWTLKMDPNKKEQISSIFLLLFSAFICFFSYHFSIGSLRAPGSGFFPFFLAAILGLLSIVNLWKAILRRKAAVEKEKPPEGGINWKNIILVVVGLLLYPLLLDFLGFLLVTFVFTAFFLRFIEPQKWRIVLGMGSGIAIIFYLIFQYWLKIQFPSGIFGI